MATVIPRLTKAGAILLAKAIGGTQLTFTRGAFGDSTSTPTAQQIDNFNALLHEKMSLPIADFKTQNNQAVVTLLVKNENVTAGFRITEGGLFARNPDNAAQEILYAYFYDGEQGDYMPAGNGDFQLEYEYEFITAVANAANVTAIIDKSSVGVSREEFEAHVNATNPHPSLDHVTHSELTSHVNSTNPHPSLDHVTHSELTSHVNSTNPHPSLDHVTHSELTSHVNSTNPHPSLDHVTHSELTSHVNSTNPHPNWEVVKAGVGLSKSNNTLNVTAATDKKLGGVKVGLNLYMDGESLNAAGDEGIDARLKQIEINQANLYLLLEAANKFGVQSNLQLVEDFKTLKVTNFYEADATVAAKNNKFFTLSDITGLRASNFCVISNGLLFNQEVTTTAVEKTADAYRVSVNSALSQKTSNAKVYRTTVNIKDGKAYGAGWIKYNRQKASKTWKGEGTSETSTLTFYAYPSLASGNSTLDGDWSLTSDGYFTLD